MGPSATKEEIAMEPSPELADLTRQLAQAIGAGDTAFLTDHTAQRAPLAFLGTDPEEWWTDVATLNQTLAAQHQAGVDVIPGDPVAYQEGSVGWAVDRTLRFRRDEEEVPFRLTA